MNSGREYPVFGKHQLLTVTVAWCEDTLSVAGNLKLGNFWLSFTDLTIPVAGIPITVSRTYDTLTANNSEDFGYSWRLEYRDTELRTSLGPDEVYQQTGVHSQAFASGTRVYLNGARRLALYRWLASR